MAPVVTERKAEVGAPHAWGNRERKHDLLMMLNRSPCRYPSKAVGFRGYGHLGRNSSRVGIRSAEGDAHDPRLGIGDGKGPAGDVRIAEVVIVTQRADL